MSKKFNHSIIRIKNSEGEYDALSALRGENSYELALRYGFTGTEEEWMESILGDGWVGAFQELETKLNTKPDIYTFRGTVVPDAGTYYPSNGAFLISVTEGMSGILTTDNFMIDLDFSSFTSAPDTFSLPEEWGKLVRVYVEKNGSLRFWFNGQPEVNLPFKVMVVR